MYFSDPASYAQSLNEQGGSNQRGATRSRSHTPSFSILNNVELDLEQRISTIGLMNFWANKGGTSKTSCSARQAVTYVDSKVLANLNERAVNLPAGGVGCGGPTSKELKALWL